MVVSTGEFNWVVEVFGIIPPRDKWTNIGVRWRPLNYNSIDDFKNRTQNGEKEEDFGGLSVFLDLKRVGFVLQPEEIGCDRCEIFGFFSPFVPSKREKNILVLLSLYVF